MWRISVGDGYVCPVEIRCLIYLAHHIVAFVFAPLFATGSAELDRIHFLEMVPDHVKLVSELV